MHTTHIQTHTHLHTFTCPHIQSTMHTCTRHTHAHNTYLHTTHMFTCLHTQHTRCTHARNTCPDTHVHTQRCVCMHTPAHTCTHSRFLARNADRLRRWSVGSWRLRGVCWLLGVHGSCVTGPRSRRPASRPLPGEAAAARGGGGDDLLGAQGGPARGLAPTLPHAAPPGDNACLSATAVAERGAGCRVGWGGARWPMPRGRHVPPVS